MLCLHQSIPSGHFVAVCVGDDTADVPITAAGISGNDPVDLGPLKALSVLGIAQSGVHHFTETVMIVSIVPSVGQFTLACCFYAKTGNVFLIIALLNAGHIGRLGVAGLDNDLDFRILHVTANGTDVVPVEGVLTLAGQMGVITAVSATVPMVGGIPIPGGNGSNGMTALSGLGIRMLIGKMLVPIRAFYAHPFAAVATGVVSNILTANQAEIAVVTEAGALRAVFLAVGADVRAILAGTAVLANQNAIRTQITVLAERIGTFQAALSATLTQRYILNVAFTAGAMEAGGHGAVKAEILVGIDLGAVAANATFHAELAATFTVTLRAIRAVHTVVDGAFDTNDLSCLLTAVQTGRTTIGTLAAFLAPGPRFEITLIAVGAVMTVIDGTFLADHRTHFTGATLIKLRTIGAQTALLAPALHIEIALFAIRAVASIANGTF